MEFILTIILLLNINRYNYLEDKFPVIELNHYEKVYNEDMIILDQLIFRAKIPFHVIDYRIIRDGREILTEQEYRRKEKAMNDEFLRQRPHFKGKLPKYMPQFIGSIMVPRYDYSRKIWVVIFYERGDMRRIYSDTFIETYTDYDRETFYRTNFPLLFKKGLKKN